MINGQLLAETDLRRVLSELMDTVVFTIYRRDMEAFGLLAEVRQALEAEDDEDQDAREDA